MVQARSVVQTAKQENAENQSAALVPLSFFNKGTLRHVFKGTLPFYEHKGT
jgi:hypothetical protein